MRGTVPVPYLCPVSATGTGPVPMPVPVTTATEPSDVAEGEQDGKTVPG